ncbi:hypothetical protein Catovirus_1_1079 [Catovirus CTV1]|uniref:Uncharacterized protein n=1 Tax=Catovirus CTV1 TaxID=1977631 RepID=A0A1V0SBF4_9VIRU|nr:hypothetical protein Catovirus_1_1079 [Catovirus CTV1]
MSTFKLVNPLILGDFGTDFSGKNANDAANQAWNSISKHINGNVPRFGFSLKDNSNDKLYHFVVKEKVSDKKIVDYSIEKIDLKLTDDQQKGFINRVNKMGNKMENKINSQMGGKKKKHRDDDDDDSSSSSDSDEVYNKLNFYTSKKYPFYYWWYNPLIYTVYGTKYSSVYIPTFNPPFYPYIELDVSSAAFY